MRLQRFPYFLLPRLSPLVLLLGCSIPSRSLEPPRDADAGNDATSAPPGDAGADGEASAKDAGDGNDATVAPLVDAGADGEASAQDAWLDADAPPSGSLDTSFGDGGIVITATVGVLSAFGLAAQGDGILYCGSSSAGGGAETRLLLGKVQENGATDEGFNGGYLDSLLASGFYVEECAAVALTPTGDIALSGWIAPYESPNMMVALRLDSSGALDPSFGTMGTEPVQDDGIDSKASGLAVQPDGELILGGFQLHTPKVTRIQTDGGVNPTFGAIPPGDASAAGVPFVAPAGANVTQVALANGGILAGLQASSPYYVARFDMSGALDPTYGAAGNPGLASTDAGLAGCTDMVARSDGSAVCVVSTPTAIQLARFTPTGALDTSFGGMDAGFASVNAYGFTAMGLALLRDGSFAVGLWSLSSQIGVARFNADGTLQQGFGQKGFATVAVATTSSVAIAEDGRGRIVVATGGVGSDGNVALARFWP